MAEEKMDNKKYKSGAACGATGGALYGVGFLGALVYFFQQATDFSGFIIGFIKALFWPAMLVYESLKFLRV
jgi:hypothetical protein